MVLCGVKYQKNIMHIFYKFDVRRVKIDAEIYGFTSFNTFSVKEPTDLRNKKSLTHRPITH